MAEVSYLIPEPKTEIGSATYLGTLLITQNAGQYACKKRTDTEEWWAIGMIANNGSWWQPCIVSNVEKYSYSYSDRYIENDNPLSTETGSFEYNGTTFYVSFQAYGSNNGSAPASATVPIYTETILPNITEAGKKLIELYKAAGGTIPEEKNEEPSEYPTSWIKKQIDGNYQKSFTYAHAKTVYIDYANKKTLADKLSEIDTEIGNKANKTEIPTELPANGRNSSTVNGHTVKSDVPENAVFTDTVYDDTEVKEEIAGINSNLGGLSFSVSGTTLSITDGTNTWTLSQ